MFGQKEGSRSGRHSSWSTTGREGTSRRDMPMFNVGVQQSNHSSGVETGTSEDGDTRGFPSRESRRQQQRWSSLGRTYYAIQQLRISYSGRSRRIEKRETAVSQQVWIWGKQVFLSCRGACTALQGKLRASGESIGRAQRVLRPKVVPQGRSSGRYCSTQQEAPHVAISGSMTAYMSRPHTCGLV